MSKSEPRTDTRALRTGHRRTHELEHSEPMFLTSSFVFENAAQAAARFAGDVEGNIYSRFTNPSVRAFEERLAAMEGTEACLGTASGMSAITAMCMGLLRSGDHIVSSRSVFGTTVGLYRNLLSPFGIETTFVPLTDIDAWRQAITPRTRFLYLETPSNPLTEVADIAQLAELAHAHDCLLVVDNCFCTPSLQRPIEFGADLIIHSATKFLDGQGRCVGGAVLGPAELLKEKIFPVIRTAGPSMSPFNAWVFLKGLETLGIRMRAQSQSAQAVAEWLQQQPGVRQVFFPGLVQHPQFDLAARQQSAPGAVLSFEVEGGRDGAWRTIDSAENFSITANLGDTRSTITHPATTTHNRLTDAEREAAGISDGLVRVSIGLEDPEDLCEGLAPGLT